MKPVFSAIAALALAGAGMAAAPATAQDAVHAGTIEVPVNKSQVVSADRAIARAMVGNAEVADVLPISERSVYVLGKKFGTTSLTLYDRTNRVIAVMDVEVGPDVEGLRTQMAELIPGAPVEARISAGNLLLTGMVNDPGAAVRAAQLAKAYAGDSVINLIQVGGSQQVMLEVKFAEINRQIGEKLGVDHGFLGRDVNGVIGEGAGIPAGTNTPTLGAISDTFGILTAAFNIGSLDIESTLNVLERKGFAKLLAEPTLVALSGEKASFLAGGEFPIPVAQSSSGGTGAGASNAITVEFKPFGVSLGFTPTVLGDKVISLIVEPEVSSIDSSASVTINGLTVPGLQTRRASTTVELRDGESFAIAGLLRNDFQTTVRQLPLLGNIPILGALFRSSSFQKGETELMIVVTPRLVAPLRPNQVRLPTDRVADPKPSDVITTGDSYRPIPIAPVPGALPADAALSPQASAGTPAALPAAAPANQGDGYDF